MRKEYDFTDSVRNARAKGFRKRVTPEAMENLRAIQKDAMARGLNYSMEEIDEIIRKARKERKVRPK